MRKLSARGVARGFSARRGTRISLSLNPGYISLERGLAITDHEVLSALNTDYINSVQNGDVKRFDEILAAEFYVADPDGSLVDRACF